MPIDIQCPKCGSKGQIPAAPPPEHKFVCSQCKTIFTLSGGQVASSQESDPLDVHGAWVDPPLRVPVNISQSRLAQADQFSPPAPVASAISGRDTPGGLDWLRQETERFNRYVNYQFEKIKAARQKIAEMESDAETKLLTREMENNRINANLVARQEELVARQEEIERRSTEIETSGETFTEREAELARWEERLNVREEEIAAQEASKTALKTEVTDLGRLAADLRSAVDRLKQRKAEAEAGRANIAAAEAALERRIIEVGRSELLIQRRLDDIDELEQNLRVELEVREQELERQRMMVEEEARAVRGRVGVNMPTPPPMMWHDSKPSLAQSDRTH